MSKEKLVELGLTEEQAVKVLDVFKDSIPRTRLNEALEGKKQAESIIAERDKQLEELKKSMGDNEALKKQIETLQNDNKTAKLKYEADLKNLQINGAVEKALISAGAKNMKAVKALLNLEGAELDGENVKGLAEQIKALQSAEDSKFLFTEPTTTFKGTKGGEGTGNPPAKAVKDMNYSERVAYLAAGGKLE